MLLSTANMAEEDFIGFLAGKTKEVDDAVAEARRQLFAAEEVLHQLKCVIEIRRAAVQIKAQSS